MNRDVLEELDEWIEIQKRSVERATQTANEAEVLRLTTELTSYLKVKKMMEEKSENEVEHMFNLDKKVVETALYMACNQNKEGKQRMVEVCNEIANDMLNKVTPMTNHTAPYIIAALRFLADKFENQLDDGAKPILCIASKIMNSLEMETKKEDMNEINNEKS